MESEGTRCEVQAQNVGIPELERTGGGRQGIDL